MTTTRQKSRAAWGRRTKAPTRRKLSMDADVTYNLQSPPFQVRYNQLYLQGLMGHITTKVRPEEARRTRPSWTSESHNRGRHDGEHLQVAHASSKQSEENR